MGQDEQKIKGNQDIIGQEIDDLSLAPQIKSYETDSKTLVKRCEDCGTRINHQRIKEINSKWKKWKIRVEKFDKLTIRKILRMERLILIEDKGALSWNKAIKDWE